MVIVLLVRWVVSVRVCGWVCVVCGIYSGVVVLKRVMVLVRLCLFV